MDLGLFVPQTLGAAPIFTTRAFSPLLIAALVNRFGESWLAFSLNNLYGFKTIPVWFTDDNMLYLLGGLTIVEYFASRNSVLSELLVSFGAEIKALAFFLYSSLMAGSSGIVTAVLTGSGFSSISFESIWSLVITGLVWYSAKRRQSIYANLREGDADDDIGLQRLLAWIEELWVIAGMLLLIVYPLAAVIVAGLTLVGLWLTSYVLKLRAEKQKTTCFNCNELNHPSALQCFNCRQESERVQAIGLFGQSTKDLVTDNKEHRSALISKKRCPVCATHLDLRAISQPCVACGTKTFASKQEAENFLAMVEAKLSKSLWISLCLGFIPVLGLIPGIIYYKINLIAGIRGYIPRGKNMLMRWLVRILNLFLILLQSVPLIGIVCLPLMCYTNFKIYRRQFNIQIRKRF